MNVNASGLLDKPELSLTQFGDGTLFGIVYALWRAQRSYPYDEILCMPDDLNEALTEVEEILAQASVDDPRIEKSISHWAFFYVHKIYECSGDQDG